MTLRTWITIGNALRRKQEPVAEPLNKLVNYAIDNRTQSPGENVGRKTGIVVGRAIERGKETLGRLVTAGKKEAYTIREATEREVLIGQYDDLVDRIESLAYNHPVKYARSNAGTTVAFESDGAKNRKYNLSIETPTYTETIAITFNGRFTHEEFSRTLTAYGNALLEARKGAQGLSELHQEAERSIDGKRTATATQYNEDGFAYTATQIPARLSRRYFSITYRAQPKTRTNARDTQTGTQQNAYPLERDGAITQTTTAQPYQ
ncbi:TPA: hypothetical protein HA251_06645 [Candidatus Woesearchaeota archaeon]|nr:hypothetical protein [Candidatus Woesearchaeota archaeon]